MNVETLSFRRPRIVALALLVIISAGLSAFFSLGRQEDPTITNLFAVITTLYPGAEPSRVESLVTRPLEDELRRLPEIKLIESSSANGVSVVSLELDETTDPTLIEGIWSEARDAVDAVRQSFPSDALAPDFDSNGVAAFGAIFALKPSTTAEAPAILARYADELAERLRLVPGSRLVERFGEPKEEVLVQLDPLESAALGLTAQEVAQAISAADAKVPAGRVLSSDTDVLLDVAGDFEALHRLRGIVLIDDGRGQVIRLGDIATLSRGARTPTSTDALSAGRRAILIGVQVDEGLQVDRWMGWLEDEVERFRGELPATLTVEQVFDQADYTRKRLAEVAINMAIGIGLVVLVLLLTLGVRAAIIVATVLPLVSLATLASMNLIGLPIHQMSVTGLIVALGLMVDAAIVMTDEIRQRLAAGLKRLDAVSAAVRRLTVPLLASTITTALSFVPMILLPGGAGDFVGAIAVAVVLMLCWSLVIALSVTPAIAGWMLPEPATAGRWSNGLPSAAMGRIFRGSLAWSTRHPLRSIALALVLPATGFLCFPMLTAQFFPGVERNQFHIEVELAGGTSIERTRELALEMDAVLRATDGIQHVAWTIGESAPAFYYNIVGSRQNQPVFAQALITTESAATTATLLAPLQQTLSSRFAQARVLVRGLVQGPPVNAPVEFRLIGPDLETLRRLGEQARTALLSLDAVTTVRSSLEGGAPKVRVDVDAAAARLVGLDEVAIARQLQGALDGVTGGSLIEGSERLPVRVRLGDGLRGDLSRIANLMIVPPASRATSGDALAAIPLSALAAVSLIPSNSTISRRNGNRLNTVQAFLVPDVLPEEVLQQAERALDDAGFALPAGYRLEFGGDADARNETVNNLLTPLGLIITLSIATIVLTFNSFRLSLVTFVVALLSAGLSLLSLAVFHYPFGITAIIGVIGSIGVSINAAIIILTGLQRDSLASAGDSDAMADVVMASSRHIISTTFTTFGGFLPLILGGGGFWPPFAMSIAGGVLLSSVVSFYFTAPMFALLRPRDVEAESWQIGESC